MRLASSLCRDSAHMISIRQTIPMCGTFSTTLTHARQVRTMLEKIRAAIEAAVPDCLPQIVHNSSPSSQHSLLVEPARAIEVARFLRDSPDLRLDYCSNVSGVDWLDKEISEKVTVKKLADGMEQEVE